MKVKIKFLGGAKSVTGSRYMLEVDQKKILFDCGLFQGLKELRLRNWDSFPVSPADIDMILLTHAHIDHSGYLPKLVKEGFGGSIYCTFPTMELVKILLTDSGKLQEEEAEFARKKGFSKHEKPEPLYTREDAEKVFPLLFPLDFESPQFIDDHLSFTFYNAGHILGAAILKMKLKGDHQEKILVLSGDLGRFYDPILNPPVKLPFADILLMESTYGNRKAEIHHPEEELGRAIRQTFNKGGVALIPSFAVGRTQLILYYLHLLQQKGKIPNIPIYVDSPMAIDVTYLYKNFRKYHRLGAHLDEFGDNPFAHKNLHYYQTHESSVSLNAIRGDAIILSASGMATGGRILHHLYHRLPNEQDSVIFVGFQAEGTRGRKIVDGEEMIRIYGMDIRIKADVYHIEGLSAHADQEELMEWAEGFTSRPKKTFLIHGEPQASDQLAKRLKEELEWNTIVPEYLESFMLFDGI